MAVPAVATFWVVPTRVGRLTRSWFSPFHAGLGGGRRLTVYEGPF